ncbi:SGNH/GDSL hydrolase family protein [Streptomyces hygroscopicus]|uniref:SGNH/GDSL hydrolase family protein n=1 Tax=Streptomyces hygroscopicus TaxID=1912 RepID=UPI0007DB18BA|nr:SGNH/GDSL hydrolase family protein [Streptomyces sp. NBRC 109436]
MVACAALTGGLLQAAPVVAAPKPNHGRSHTTPPTPPSRVADPGSKLGKGWNTSADRAVTLAADSDGVHVLVADSAKAYEWRNATVLSEPGMPADSWIGNQCVIDHEHAAVVYAPRTFTNKPDLMQGGAFAAIVNLDSGKVIKLPFTASLAYFDPTCNPDTRTAAFTGYRDMNDPRNTKTRIVSVNTAGKTTFGTVTGGEITSAVPVKDGTIAARGRHLVHINRSGKVKDLATTDSVPFDIRPATHGKIAFVDRSDNTTAHAKLFTGHGRPDAIAAGKLGDLGLHQGAAGQVFLTGHPTGTLHTKGTGVTRINAPSETDISTLGRLAVNPVLTPGVRAGLERIKNSGKGFTKAEPSSQERSAQAPATVTSDTPMTVTSTATTTGEKITQSVQETMNPTGKGIFSPALTAGGSNDKQTQRIRTAAGVSNTPVDTDRWCSVSRNDVNAQALQPTPNQVEWAVDMAVRGKLRVSSIRQGGYRSQTGMSTIDPQGLFPLPKLTGGGRIPVNVLLGIMAQESNLWQAESGSIPGQMGSPLAAVDGYYGHKAVEGDPDAFWQINWDKSDCGYGVGQVTDGMRLAGHEKDHETSLSPALQKAVAVDYATNIAASMKILADKWNEVHTDGQKVTVNNDNPAMVENWFTAAWNYNLGFNPPSDASKHDGHWGLGWYNNPANPIYKKSWGHPFMDTSVDPGANHDAAHPQDWPYEEKVMGWAAWSIDTGFSYGTSGRQDWLGESGFSSAGFQPAWWTTPGQRSLVSPPLDTFCNSNNNCNPDTPPDCPNEACYAKYWWNQPNVAWKVNCDTSCGHENIKYQTEIPEPGRGYRLKDGTPVCSGVPDGSHVVASIPKGTETWSDCGQATSSGSFQFTFYPGTEGRYEAKADLHQVGGGYGGHYWYTHTRSPGHLGGPNGYMTINGTWTLGQNLNWARVLVHLPDTGAQTRQATYVVHGSDSSSPRRRVLQRAGGWVPLGVFHFTGTPQVELSNNTADGTADEDIAWGAVAFQPLAAKPKNFVVAMGDSYSSGEGASAAGGTDFFPETDHYDKLNDKLIDKCHRSKLAWSRQAALPGSSKPIGDMADSLDPQMDYHFVACSGARHYDILNHDQMSEGAQVDTGYLDGNTTLVTLSVGGNDARFTDVFMQCVLKAGLDLCQDTSIDNKDPDDGHTLPGNTGPLKDWAPKWLHDQIRPRIAKTLNVIHGKAPNAKIVLMGYPRLLSAGGQCIPGIGTEEAPWLNQVADTLDEEMKGAVSDANQSGAKAVFADPRNEFEGKTVCGDPEDVNGIVKTGLSKADNFGLTEVGMATFHPKIAGARLYTNVLEQTLK